MDGQRIHSVDSLKTRIAAFEIDPSTMEEYMRGFEYALPSRTRDAESVSSTASSSY